MRLDDAVAVVADHMGAAKKGLAALAIEWDDGPNAKLSTADIVRQLEEATSGPARSRRTTATSTRALAGAATKVEAIYQMPFLAHAAMEPMNCTVHVRKDGCEIWVGTQASRAAQAAAAQGHRPAAGEGRGPQPLHRRRLRPAAGSGRRRPRGQDRAAGRRPGEGRLEPRGGHPARHVPALLLRPAVGRARCRRAGRWPGRTVSPAPRSSRAMLPPAFKNGLDPDAVEGAVDLAYALPNIHVEYVRVEPPGIPTAFWRGVGPSHNVFVVESFIDELAAAAKQDPVAYRLALLGKKPRAKAVLELAAEKAGWGQPLPRARPRRLGAVRLRQLHGAGGRGRGGRAMARCGCSASSAPSTAASSSIPTRSGRRSRAAVISA